jgi:hypothetical protein
MDLSLMSFPQAAAGGVSEIFIKECSILDKEIKEHNDRLVICGVHNG